MHYHGIYVYIQLLIFILTCSKVTDYVLWFKFSKTLLSFSMSTPTYIIPNKDTTFIWVSDLQGLNKLYNTVFTHWQVNMFLNILLNTPSGLKPWSNKNKATTTLLVLLCCHNQYCKIIPLVLSFVHKFIPIFCYYCLWLLPW